MKRSIAHASIALTLLGAVLLASGCGAKGVKVEGQLVSDGAPVVAEEGNIVNLSFVGKQNYHATVKPDGSFVFLGPKGNGIPPGSYKVRVNASTPANDPASLKKLAKADEQFKKINDVACEVGTESSQKFTIDVKKGTVSK
jgi:hypothetical protein